MAKQTYKEWLKSKEEEEPIAAPLVQEPTGNVELTQPLAPPEPPIQPQAKEQTYDTSPFDAILPPQRDEEKEKRLKKVAAVNSIGDALRVVVQAMGATKGANVTPLATAQTTDNALNRLQFLDDQFKNEQQRYDMMKYQDQYKQIDLKRQDDQIAKTDERYDKQWERSGQEIKKQDERYKDSVDWRNKTHKAQQEQQNKVFAENKRQFDERLAAMYNEREMKAKIKEIEAYTKAEIAAGKEVALTLLDDGMNPRYAIDESELNAIMAKISANPAAKREIDTFKIQFGDGLTKEAKKYFVQKYWQLVKDDFKGLTPLNYEVPAGQQPINQSIMSEAQKLVDEYNRLQGDNKTIGSDGRFVAGGGSWDLLFTQDLEQFRELVDEIKKDKAAKQGESITELDEFIGIPSDHWYEK